MILLMGIAGSGKGTQGKMLADTRGLHLMSMGDILRMHVTGEQRERMLAGGLLDDGEIIKIVDQVLQSLPHDKDELILDGFPRTIPQAEWLLEQAQAGRFQISNAIHLVASRQAVKKRLLNRARVDDIESAIDERFDEYERSTMPVLKWLSQNGINVHDVNAERSVEAVNDDIVKLLDGN
jgi:adenylate kinase